jgi:hypothetical protein
MARAQAGALFGWPQLNAALAEHRLAPPRLRLERGGEDVSKGVFATRRTRRGAILHDLDLGALNAGLRDGATLILDAANELSPSLQRLCAGLAADFACACQTNMYACWGATQGFDVHWDDHDVFVIQLEGRKRWDLYGATREAPTRRDHHGEHPRPEAPRERIVLEPGDVLYLPRGYWHAAVGLGGPTMHLTVGLTRKTGSDFLHWLADDVLADAAARADLPFEDGEAAVGARIAELLAELARRDPQSLARRYRRHIEAGLPQRPQPSFPWIGGRETAPGPGDRIRLADGASRVGPSERPGALLLSWRGTEFTLDADLGRPLEVLVAGGSLTLGEIEGAASPRTRSHVAGFVREMLGRGVFMLDETRA